MVDAVDRLDPLPPEVAGGVTFLVDRCRPVAVLRDASGVVRVVTWPDAPLPARSATARLYPAPGCVWVVYAEDAMDDPADPSTAVRIGADGQVDTCELGDLEAIGADDQGVWLSAAPYLAMEEGLPGGDDEELEEPDEGAELPAGPPAWVQHAPVESWENFERARREADEADAQAGTGKFFAIEPPQGAEGESFGWFAYPPGQEREEPAPLPELPAPAPTGPAVLRRVRVDGEVDEVLASRVVSRVQVSGHSVLRLVFHPTGPVLSVDPDGRGYDVHYPQRVAEIDISDGLPANLDLDALASQPGDEEEDDEEEPAVDEGDRVDLSGIAGTRWAPRPLEAGQVAAAVEAVRAQYADLDQPHLVHTARDDRWHRVQAEYADLGVRVEGTWPHTEVVVDFIYLPAPGAPLRRRTRVFDDTGAPTVSPYLGVYLDEDLATTNLDELPVREGHRHI